MKKQLIKLLILLTFLSVTFAELLTNYNDLKLYLDEQEKVYEDITNQYGLATWFIYSQEGKPNLDTPSERYAELFADEKLNNVINEWHSKLDEIYDEELKARVIIWKRILTGARVNYDEEIAELKNKLEEWISHKDAPDRPEETKLAEMVKELMVKRNTKVKELGYNDYGDFILELSGQGKKSFYKMIDELLKTTESAYDEVIAKLKSEGKEIDLRNLAQYFKRGNTPKTNFKPEDYEKVMAATVADIGFNYERLPVKFVDKTIPYGGNCISVNIPDDVRIVCLPRVGLRTRFHELGHGIQTAFTKVKSPILKGYEWCLGSANGLAYFEGMAETMAKFYSNTEWLKKHTELTEDEIKESQVQDKYVNAVTLRFTIAMFLTEFEMYKNLDKDPNEVNKMVYKKIFKNDIDKLRPINLASVFYVAYPCYMQNYLIADIISWQVHKTLEEKFGNNYPFMEETGNFIKDKLCADGVTRHWQKRLKDATGKELDVSGYLKHKGF